MESRPPDTAQRISPPAGSMSHFFVNVWILIITSGSLSLLFFCEQKKRSKRKNFRGARCDCGRHSSSSNRSSTVLKAVYSGVHRRGTLPVSPWRFLATMHSAMFRFSVSSL